MTHEDDQLARLKKVLYDNNIPKTLAISPLSKQMYAAGLRVISPDALAAMEDLRKVSSLASLDKRETMVRLWDAVDTVLAHGYPDPTPARAVCAADGMDDAELGLLARSLVGSMYESCAIAGQKIRALFTTPSAQSTVQREATEATAPKEPGVSPPGAAGGCPAPQPQYSYRKTGDTHWSWSVINNAGDAEIGTWTVARCWDEAAAKAVADSLNVAKATPAPHASDCAIYNMPAYPAAPCDCGAQTPAPGSKIYCGAEGCAGVPWMVPYLQTAPLTQEDLDWAETDVDRIEAQRATVPIPLEALWTLRYVLDQQYAMARDYAGPLIPAIRAVLLAAGVITTDGLPVPVTPEYAAWADA